MTLRVGLDFDNTLIDYNQVFGKIFVAEMARRGFATPPSPGGKQAVKRAAIDIAGEEFWMAIQGQAYGRGIDDARLIDGVGAFFAAANRQAAELFIVSHKTEFGHFDDSRTNLREAARNWMDRHGFFTRQSIPSRLRYYNWHENSFQTLAEHIERVFPEGRRGFSLDSLRQHFIDYGHL